ncbi:flagellin [Clostridium oceanicum]|uniref:Flagellin n=1 Tax=Clostridium oceanicum TaxID=1543 RepID=A0ABP3V480_9CLOT
MRLPHNLASLNIFRTYSGALKDQSAALNRISTGYKVMTAKDDPNIIAQSERTKIQVRSLHMAARNSQDGVSMVQTAEGGLQGIGDMIKRVRELVIQSGSVNTDHDKKVIQKEINQLVEGIDDIANNTEFNGVKLLNKNIKGKEPEIGKMPVGANVGEVVDIPFYKLDSKNLPGGSVSLNDVNVTNGEVDKSLEIVDAAMNKVLGVRNKYGAISNRFEKSMNNIKEIADRMDGANGRLVDADIAEEMMGYARGSIMTEASMAIMKQTNDFPIEVLRILENVR